MPSTELLKWPAGQVVLGLGLDRVAHVDHLGEEEQPDRRLGLVGVDELGVPLAAHVLGAEEVLHRAVPVDDAVDAGQLVALEELVQRRLEHPQLAVVVDDDLLAEAVVPQAEHDVDESLLDHLLAQHHGARHAEVVVGMAAVHERRQRQGDRRAALGGVAAHGLADLAHEEGVHGRHGVAAVVLGAADGDQHDVVLAPLAPRPARGSSSGCSCPAWSTRRARGCRTRRGWRRSAPCRPPRAP